MRRMNTLVLVILGLPLVACREDGTPVPVTLDATAPGSGWLD